jgi:bifunctional enzyme CysN/CysC
MADAQLLRFSTAGSVDDGKSTLIGRLLFDTGGAFDDEWESVRDRAGQVDLARLTDGLRAEREQGITIDVAYRYFATPRRKFVVADTPGHLQYTRNMVVGTSLADVAIVLVDATRGISEQTRRHAFLASLLRVPRLLLAINKMDRVGYAASAFDRLAEELARTLGGLGFAEIRCLPISALHGDGVVRAGTRMPWYGGPTLLGYLESVPAGEPPRTGPRIGVQLTLRGTLGDSGPLRGYGGTLVGGILCRGDSVGVWPSGAQSRIARLFAGEQEISQAIVGQAIGVQLTDELDVGRGDWIAAADSPPRVASRIGAVLCWMSGTELAVGRTYALRQSCRYTRCQVLAVEAHADLEQMAFVNGGSRVGLNAIARVSVRTLSPIVFDTYAASRETGGFLLVDEATGETVAAGMITGALPG